MKKIIFLFSLFMILSCSSSNDSASSSDFNPPAWIQGTWLQEGSTPSLSTGFKFYSNDFCTLIVNAEQCQKGLVDLIRKGGESASVVETISNTSYSAKINYVGGQSATYTFSKISNTEIEYMGLTYIKQ